MKTLLSFIASVSMLVITTVVQAQAWTAEMDSLAKETEAKYKLRPGTCKAFSWQESNHNPYAIRVEANYVEATGAYAKRVRMESRAFSKANNGLPSYLTEVYQMGTSWTQYQIMGVNVRALGYKSPFLYPIPMHTAFDMFGRFFSNLVKKHNGDYAYAIGEYNGGYGAVMRKVNGKWQRRPVLQFRNLRYVTRVTAFIREFSN